MVITKKNVYISGAACGEHVSVGEKREKDSGFAAEPKMIDIGLSPKFTGRSQSSQRIAGAVGGEGGDEDDKEKEEEAERERQEAIKEAEDRRKEKHRKMEEEREKMRQEIRDKYNIKKREEVQEMMPQEEPNPLMRKKKTPEELAAEAEAEDEDEFTKLKNSITTGVTELKTKFDNGCSLQ
ncbi:complexin [Venturia canescens]|uniref:complexin n=1 Tax=Venturia canescens TaxID=32260 RepID=UPI001C9CC626|nr:complexin [Venturia canescens]